MKQIKIIALLVFLLSPGKIFSQESKKKVEEIKIKTSAVCDMCKFSLEKAMAYEKGVKKSELNVETKIFTVWYKPSKTTPEKIRKAISKVGYDADDVPADPKAYESLDACCKKEYIQ